MADFKETEHAAWVGKAAAYDDHFAQVTARAIPSFLECAQDLSGLDVLDICCGTGDLTQALSLKQANVTGLDFAEPMVSIARTKYPKIPFSTGDAEALDFADNSFDLITCAFGLWHLAHPDRAVAQVARLLRPGGRFIYSAWTEQTKNHQAMYLISDAVRRLGRVDVDLPPAPPPYRFANHDTASAALKLQGFTRFRLTQHSACWLGRSGGDLLDLIMRSTVRAPMLIQAQSPDARDAIKRDIARKAQAMKVDGTIKIDWPYALVTAGV